MTSCILIRKILSLDKSIAITAVLSMPKSRTVSSETLDCSADCVKKMNVSGLTQGAYFVRIYGENVDSVKKLIIR